MSERIFRVFLWFATGVGLAISRAGEEWRSKQGGMVAFAWFETGEAFRTVAVEAFDAETRALVACYPLRTMHEWLTNNGYSWREGSSGIWERAA